MLPFGIADSENGPTDWELVFAVMAKTYGFTADDVGDLTLPQLSAYLDKMDSVGFNGCPMAGG